jgi:hypothetical protein
MPPVLASLFFQSVVVAFASYLAWFWLLTRYLAGRLSVFSFLAPLFGVSFGVLLLDEPLTARFRRRGAAGGHGNRSRQRSPRLSRRWPRANPIGLSATSGHSRTAVTDKTARAR